MNNKLHIEILKEDARWLREQIVDLKENEDKDISESLINGCKVGIAAHEAAITRLQNDWVSVEDGLPEYTEEDESTRWSSEVIFLCHREQYIGYLSEKYNEWMNKEETKTFKLNEVTHWRNLPAPPKGAGQS